jgi:hypothetical protein
MEALMPEPQPVGREQEQAVPADVLERRAWVRYGTDLEALCRGPGRRKAVGWPARVRDISAGGVGLLLRHRFRPGSYLAVELHSPSGGCLRVLGVRVVHTTPTSVDGEPCWVTGCLLTDQLTDDEVQALLQP